MICLLLALFDEALQGLPSVCSCCFPSEAYCDRCQHGRLARPVAAVVLPISITLLQQTIAVSVCRLEGENLLSDNEVDQWAQANLQISMTHEIGASDSLENAIICRLIVQLLLVP